MKKIGLVVEGGGTKAAYSAGVLKCLLDHQIYIPYSVGISAGVEILTSYVSRQSDRLAITGIEAPCQKGVVGLRPFFKEGSLYGLESTKAFIESRCPLDFETFLSSSTELKSGVYNLETNQVEYWSKQYVDSDFSLIKASCALLLLAHPYQFQGHNYMDAGLVDMISIDQSIKDGNEKHIVISTKELGYQRKPAPKYQQLLAKLVYKDDTIVQQLKERHIRYSEQWEKVTQLEKEGKALVLRPHQDMNITRFTTDPKKLHPWFQLGVDETKARLEEIKAFIEK